MSNEEKKPAFTYNHDAVDRELASLSIAELERLAKDAPAKLEHTVTPSEFRAYRATNALARQQRQAKLDAENKAKEAERAKVQQQEYEAERAAFAAGIRVNMPALPANELEALIDRLWTEELERRARVAQQQMRASLLNGMQGF